MAEEGFEVPQPHEKLVEEHAEHDDLAQRIALVTAVLATIGAVFSYQSGANQNQAIFLKNEGIRLQAQASDQWAYYQSTSTKSHLAKIAAELATNDEAKQKFLAEAAREDVKKDNIQKTAESLEKQSEEKDKAAEEVLKPHERLALGMTLIQIAVALASITVLTRRKWLFWGCLASALGGIGVAISGFV
ncbi:MAG: DUF4337 domain-containing protein [Burkholderiales bacterium]|nr:DUF4337 domain-containing protein [Burkholderiales bacterium]